jgi:tetratricopeptide (TPR) repeat protein
VIGRDPRIREATAQNLGSILTGRYFYFDPTAGLYRPFTTLSYLVNYAVFGNGPRGTGYHAVNLALHEVNVALVYALGLAILGGTAPAVALAATWGLHPVLTESVTNIVGRADLLAAFGVLAGLLCHVGGASTAGRRRLAWLLGLAAAQAVGLFSKESATVLPAIMVLYDLTWRERAGWRRQAAAYGAVALPVAAFFYLRSGVHVSMLIEFSENPLVGAGFWAARMTAVKVIGKFLWLYLWPARLSADYSFNAVPLFGGQASTWENLKAILALAVLLGAALLAVLLAVRSSRTGRPLLFFLIFFFVALAPVSNMIVLIGSIMAERFLYLPSVGLAGSAVAAIWAVGRRRPQRWALAMLVVACLAFTARTYARNFDWQDDVSLWRSAVDVCPGDSKAHYNLAKALQQIPGRLPEAITEYQAAVAIDPGHPEAHRDLGNALEGMPGRLPEAIAEFQAALRVQPGNADAHDNLANALARIRGKLPEAIAEYQAALRIDPMVAERHYNLANALLRSGGRLPEAIAEYQAALRIEPDLADAHNNLGNALTGTPGRMPEAIAEYQAALRIAPEMADAHNNLGNALAGIPGRMTEAIAEYQAALRIKPDLADAHNNLGRALSRIPGRMTEAIAEYQAALRARPDFAEAHLNLGNALAEAPGRLPEAITEYETALRIRPDPEVVQMVERLQARRQ